MQLLPAVAQPGFRFGWRYSTKKVLTHIFKKILKNYIKFAKNLKIFSKIKLKFEKILKMLGKIKKKFEKHLRKIKEN